MQRIKTRKPSLPMATISSQPVQVIHKLTLAGFLLAH
jgi:hypothetical protein